MKKLVVIFCVFLLVSCQSFDLQKNVIYLAGDSTIADKAANKRPETGWGEKLGDFFVEGVQIENHAQNGRSSRSFIKEGRWETIVSKLKKGDVVFIQFGHNDTKTTEDRFSTPEQYGENLLRFVRETRARKAIPVLLTSVVRRRFDEEGQFYDTHGAYPGVVRDIAKQHKVTLIDLQQISEQKLRAMGEASSRSFFLWLEKGEHPNYPEGVEDNTHFSPEGATFMASQVAEALRQSDLAIRKYLKEPALP